MAIITLDSAESATRERVTGGYTDFLALARVSCKKKKENTTPM